jgi:hypothetical protein
MASYFQRSAMHRIPWNLPEGMLFMKGNLSMTIACMLQLTVVLSQMAF